MIVAFCGKAGAGKDTAAQVLYSRKFMHINLADPMKRALNAMLPKPTMDELKYSEYNNYMRSQAWKDMKLSYIEGEPTIRHLLQTLGTEWGRSIHEDFWINIWHRNSSHFKNVMLTDLRFPNEEKFLRSKDAKIIKIVSERSKDLPHASESYDIEADITLINDSTPEALHKKVLKAIYGDQK